MTVAKMPARELPKNDATQAVCSAIVDCGEHEGMNFQGQLEIKPKLIMLFEIDQMTKRGQRFVLSQQFNNSLHKKSSLRKFIGDWRGEKVTDEEAVKGIDLDSFVGKNLFITPDVSSGYANIGTIMKLPPSMPLMRPTLKELPPWVHALIQKAKIPPAGYQGVPAGQAPVGEDGENLPF